MSVTDLGAVWQVYKQDSWLNLDIDTIHIEWFVVVACELDTSNARSLKLLVHIKDTKDNYYTKQKCVQFI